MRDEFEEGRHRPRQGRSFEDVKHRGENRREAERERSGLGILPTEDLANPLSGVGRSGLCRFRRPRRRRRSERMRSDHLVMALSQERKQIPTQIFVSSDECGGGRGREAQVREGVNGRLLRNV